MRRRSKAVGKAIKARRRKTLTPKRRNAPKSLRRRSLSSAGVDKKLALLTRERDEASEQLTATSKILKIVSSSPGDLGPVFQSILENATHICGAKFATLYLSKEDAFYAAAFHNAPLAFVEARKNRVLRPDPESTLSRAASTKQAAQVLDSRKREAYRKGDSFVVAGADLGGYRTIISVPMVNNDKLIGVISIYRQEVRPFTHKQIELVKHFATQAVIAIENTRLLNELRQRTDDLTESLEQQTATSQVLQVISSTPGELEPVFQAMLDNAVRICGARFGNLTLFDGKNMRVAALHNAPLDFEKVRRENPIIPAEGTVLGTLAQTRQRIHIVDLAAIEEYADSPLTTAAGARSMLAVPMLKENELIGAINIYRQEVKPFSDKQIALLENFAAQAVIAIENTRLLTELRKSLEQQTGTAEVLRVISSSPGDLQPVFDTMVAKATALCEASYGAMWLREGDGFRNAALHGALPAEYVERWRNGTLIHPSPDTPMMRVAQTRQPVQLADLRDGRAYLDREPLAVAAVDVAGVRTLLSVPMFKAGEVVGAITIYRKEVRAFTDKQVALVTNFASQAVIAIENTRLLNELRESLQQQTATADVLKTISRSTFDLQAVLDTLVDSAGRLCQAGSVALRIAKDGLYHFAASYGLPPGHKERMIRIPLSPNQAMVGQVLSAGNSVHVVDAQSHANREVAAFSASAGVHTMLGVPLLREGTPIGVLILQRRHVQPFTDKQIELVETFADQAVIAIENARLFDEVQARTRDLSESLEQQTATSEVLQIISSSPGDLKPVFQAMLDNATRICEAKFGTLFRYDGEVFHLAANTGTPPALVQFQRKLGPFSPEVSSGVLGRLLRQKTVVLVDDEQLSPTPSPPSRYGGARSVVAVPMLKDNDLVGALVIYRQEVRPFTDKQVKLVQNFAAQAVIAVENTRLLNELRQRTDDLSNSLENLRTTQDTAWCRPKSLPRLAS